MSELYKAIAGSPITYLAGDISAGQTTIAVADDTALPDAPNICTIGYGEHIETIRYGTKSNGVLQDVTRGIEGTPRAWQSGTEVARFYTAYDHNAIIQTIMTHEAESATLKTIHGLRYETGSWEPRLEGGTVAGNHTYTASGRYVKINNKVTVYGSVELTSKDVAMTGAARITGLPFVVGGGSFIGSLTIGRLSGVNITLGRLIYSMPINTTTRCDIYKMAPAGVTESLQSNEISDTFSIRFSAEYYVG
jgi:hypothetical protein